MLRKIASAKDRLTAFYINVFFLALLTYLIAHILKLALSIFFHGYGFLDSLYFAFPLALFLNSLLVAKTHIDIGKLILGIEIVNYHGNKKASFLQVFFRTLISYLSIAVFGLGSLAIIFNSERISFHDLCVNTLVVENIHYLRKNILVQIFHWVFFLVGSALALGIFLVIVLSPYPLLNNYIYDTNITAYDVNNYIHSEKDIELAKFKKIKLENRTEFSIPYSNSQVYALLRFKDKAEFVDFELDPDTDKNYISKSDLKKFASENLKVFRYFSLDMDEALKFKSEPYIIVPVLSIKDDKGHDLDFYNQVFYISDSANVIAKDLLKLFDTKLDVDNSELDIKIFDFDQEIFKYKLGKKSKFILSQIARNLKADYISSLEASDIDFDLGERLNYKLIIDPNYGSIVELTLTNNVKNKDLVAFSEQFLKSYRVMVKFNKELKAKRKVELNISL